jgi:hypothetical protein
VHSRKSARRSNNAALHESGCVQALRVISRSAGFERQRTRAESTSILPFIRGIDP